jgi:hypothetical protein
VDTSAAALSSATGVTFPTPIVAPNGNGTNVCEYNLGESSPTILIGTDLTKPGVSAGTFTNGAPVVGGFGQAAWITQSHGTTTMQILNGRYVISITSNQSEAVVEKAARAWSCPNNRSGRQYPSRAVVVAPRTTRRSRR